jgi:hypothetical protein
VNELRPFTLGGIQQPAELSFRISSLPISHELPPDDHYSHFRVCVLPHSVRRRYCGSLAFVATSPASFPLWAAIRQIATATRDTLGEERLAWLRALPRVKIQRCFCTRLLVYASPTPALRQPYGLLASAFTGHNLRRAGHHHWLKFGSSSCSMP